MTDFNDVILLTLSFEYQQQIHEIHPVLLKSEGDLVLVDCGYPNFLPQLSEAMNAHGYELEELTALFITHQDDDHMGAAAALKRLYPHIEIVTSELEAPYVTGEKRNLRLVQAEAVLASMPEAHKPFGREFVARMERLEPVKVDRTVKYGERLPWAGGCEIMMTPGHTPGHASLYLEPFGFLITGDAAVVENDELVIANPQFCLDLETAKASLEQLKKLPVKQYLCFHGGRITPINR